MGRGIKNGLGFPTLKKKSGKGGLRTLNAEMRFMRDIRNCSSSRQTEFLWGHVLSCHVFTADCIRRRKAAGTWSLLLDLSNTWTIILAYSFTFFFFHICTVHLDIIKVFFISPTDPLFIALKWQFTLKFKLKLLLHASV